MKMMNRIAAMAAIAMIGPMTANERAMGRYMRDAGGHNPGDGGRGLSPDELAREIKTAFEKSVNEVKGIAEEALGKVKTGEELTATLKEKADEALLSMNTLKEQVSELEQKLARRREAETTPQSPGEALVSNEEFKAFAAQTRPRGRVVVDVKDISSLTTDAAGSVGTLVNQPTRTSAPPLPQRRMTIRALLAPGRTNSNLIEFDREKLFTNAADVVAEGVSKPQSEIQYEDASAPVRTIAHWMRASVQILQDAPGLSSIIDQRLRYGLAYKEEVQLLSSDGTGQNLNGLITQATAYAAPFTPPGTVTNIDTIRLAMLQAALAEYMANGTVLHPIDWARIELLKDTAGGYVVSNPTGNLVDARLWGLPVVPTQAITVDKFLVGAFDLAAQIFDRQDATVEVSTEDADNFTKNKVTIRAEERLALAVYRAQALIYGDFGNV